jgi:DNA-binding CsgD family transcriptional regulator
LTPRELQTLAEVATGKSDAAIAHFLRMSERGCKGTLDLSGLYTRTTGHYT